VAVFEFASFWGVRLQKLAKIDFQDSLEEAASMFPTDARLLNRAREIPVRLANGAGIKPPVLSPGGQVRADQASALRPRRQFKRAKKALRTLRTYLGRVIRDIARKLEGNGRLAP
jgi:hypothetical protein